MSGVAEDWFFPRKFGETDFYACATSLLGTLGRHLGERYDRVNTAKFGAEWFEAVCAREEFQVNLYDPEWALKAPYKHRQYCAHCVPRELEGSRRRLSKLRNYWAHHSAQLETDLNDLIDEMYEFGSKMRFQFAEGLKPLGEHVAKLVNDQSLVVDDPVINELREAVRIRDQRIRDQEQQIELLKAEMLPEKVSIAEESHSFKGDPNLVCLHLGFNGSEHSFRAERLPDQINVARLHYDLKRGVPLLEGDLIRFKPWQGGTCASVTSVQQRAQRWVLEAHLFGHAELVALYLAYEQSRSEAVVAGGRRKFEEEKMAAPMVELANSLNDTFWQTWMNELGEDSGSRHGFVDIASELLSLGSYFIEIASEAQAIEVLELFEVSEALTSLGTLAWSHHPDDVGTLDRLEGFYFAVDFGLARREALLRGWMVDNAGVAVADLNRVVAELNWDPVSGEFFDRSN